MHSLINKIQSKIKSNIFLDYDMRKSTWFRAGGRALGYVIVNNISDLRTITLNKANANIANDKK